MMAINSTQDLSSSVGRFYLPLNRTAQDDPVFSLPYIDEADGGMASLLHSSELFYARVCPSTAESSSQPDSSNFIRAIFLEGCVADLLILSWELRLVFVLNYWCVQLKLGVICKCIWTCKHTVSVLISLFSFVFIKGGVYLYIYIYIYIYRYIYLFIYMRQYNKPVSCDWDEWRRNTVGTDILTISGKSVVYNDGHN